MKYFILRRNARINPKTKNIRKGVLNETDHESLCEMSFSSFRTGRGVDFTNWNIRDS